MAGSGLVPHQLPSGQTIMVPDYLAGPGALAMPAAAAPAAGPDLRVAGPGGGPMAEWGNEIPVFDATAPVGQQQQIDQMRAALAPKGPAAPAANEHVTKPPPSKFETVGKKMSSGGGNIDPSAVVMPGRQQPAAQGTGEGGEMNPLVRRAGLEAVMGGRGGGGGGNPGMTVGGIKEERTPGKELLPELMWEQGLAARPQTVDYDQPFEADSDQPIKYKGVETGLTRGADTVAQRGQQMFEASESQRHEAALAQKEALVAQSQALDSQLGAIAERRNRIAKLQEVADKRAQEAESVEPRTRAEIWQSKGTLAQGMGLLAVALGGALQATRGGENQGAKMIDGWLNSAVDDDRYKYERASKLGMSAKNDFDRAMALYGDLDMATLDVKQRKIASTMAMAQQMLAEKGMDATAQQRGAELVAGLRQQYLQNAQQMADMINGQVVKQEVTYKPGATGGGGGGNPTLKMLKAEAEAQGYIDKITGEDKRPKPNPAEEAKMNEAEAGMVPLKNLLQKYQGSGEIPGLGGRNVVSRGVRGAADWVAGEGSGTKLLDNPEERANRIIVQRAQMAYQHAVTGAGGGEKEMARIGEAFAGAQTKHDLQVAMDVADQVLAEQRRLNSGGRSRAGATPQQAASERPDEGQ